MNQALNGRQLDLIRRTVAGDCNKEEFEIFMEVVSRLGLDPFRRQVMALVFSKDNPDKRRMSIVVGIDGQRILAQRCGDYRPASEPATFELDLDLVGPNNPAGIVSCTVFLHKQDSKGLWFPVVGEARWDEYAPLKTIWENNKPTDKFALDYKTMWPKMPRGMTTKCATQQALRAGWPDEFSGVYAEAEMDQAVASDADASDLIEAHKEENRQKLLASDNTIGISWQPGMPIDFVPVGQLYDQVMAWAEDPQHTPEMIKQFFEINKQPIRQFWVVHPGDAVALEKRLLQEGSEPTGETG